MGTNMFRKKSAKKSMFYSVIVLFFILVLTVNVLIEFLVWENTFFIDTTKEELYTLSDDMITEMDAISSDVLITFCAEPDYLLQNYESRYTYIMSMELAKHFDNIKVEYVNSEKNPEKLDKYKNTSATTIGAYDIIVSSGGRYRLLRSKSMWTTDDSGKYWAFNGEYKMACAILSVTASESPKVCFTSGHGEKYYNPNDPATSDPEYEEFYNLLLLAGLTVDYINLDTQDIPDDCVMLIINGATVDYTAQPGYIYDLDAISPIEKIDRFLSENNSVFITKDPFVSLPTLEEYMREWGLAFGDNRIQTSNREDGDRLFAEYVSSEQDPIGYSIYSEIASLASSPKTIIENCSQLYLIWADNSKTSAEKYISPGLSVMASSLLLSSDKTKPYTNENVIDPKDNNGKDIVLGAGETLDDRCGKYTLSAISVRTRYVGVNYYYSYMFVSGTSSMLKNEYIGESSYANYDIVFSTVRTLTRTDRYASDDLGAISLNTEKYGGKILLSTELSKTNQEEYENGKLVRTYSAMSTGKMVLWTVIMAIVPVLVIPIIGTYVYLKRKNK